MFFKIGSFFFEQLSFLLANQIEDADHFVMVGIASLMRFGPGTETMFRETASACRTSTLRR
ncbi:MAG: hypothetical protein JXA07_05665 [Spirochaetes bacterium]|nr:hypothetical protein [Spirochaetota bacterium]